MRDNDKNLSHDSLLERPSKKYDTSYIKNVIDLDALLLERKGASKSIDDKKKAGSFVIGEPIESPIYDTKDDVKIYNPKISKTKNRSEKPQRRENVAVKDPSKVETASSKESEKEKLKVDKSSLSNSLDNMVMGDHFIEEKLRKNRGTPAKITAVREFVQTAFDDENLSKNHKKENEKFVVQIPEDVESAFFSEENFIENKAVFENLTFEEQLKKIRPEDTITDLEFPKDIQAEEKTQTILSIMYQPEEEVSQLQKNPLKKFKKRNQKFSGDIQVTTDSSDEKLHGFDIAFEEGELKAHLYHCVQKYRKLYAFATFLTLLGVLLVSTQYNSFLQNFWQNSLSFLPLHLTSCVLSLIMIPVCYLVLEEMLQEIKSLKPSVATAGFLLLIFSALCDFTAVTSAPISAYAMIFYLKLMKNQLYKYRKARIDSKLVFSKGESSYPLSLEEKGLFADSLGNKVKAARYIRGSAPKQYFTQAFSKNSSEKLCAYLFIASVVVFGFFYFLQNSNSLNLTIPQMAVYAITATCPICLLYAFNCPYKSFSDLLRRKGALIAGQNGVDKLFELDEIVFSDNDMFADRPPVIAGIKLYGEASFETAVTTAASLAYQLEQPLLKAFMHILDNNMELLQSVEDMRYLDKSGIYAYLNGNVVVLGTENFLKQNLIRLPKDDIGNKIRSNSNVPLYLAINGVLSAVFSVNYTVSKQLKESVNTLVKSGVGLLISTNDPLLSEELVAWIFGINYEYVRIVPIKRKEDLWSDIGKKMPISALIGTRRLYVFIKAIACAFRLKNTVNVNLILSVLCSVITCLLMGFFIMSASSSLLETFLNPLVIIVYQLLWIIPSLVITFFSKSICK